MPILKTHFRQALFQIEPAVKDLNIKGEMDEYTRTLGTCITFGDMIQLRHLHSNAVLSVSDIIPSKMHGTLKIELAEK